MQPVPASPEQREQCARMLAGSQPWITLGRSLDASREMLADAAKELHVVADEQGAAGFVLLDMRGVFRGYLQTICVREDRRGQGLGGALIAWTERRVFRDSPNLFLCVSSFNDSARRLYERLGYERIGEIGDFLVRGHSEILMRKSIGPWSGFRPGA